MSEEFILHESEVWKDIPGFEGYYQASSLGRIKGRGICKQQHNTVYPKITLWKDGVCKTFAVHRLIFHSFKGYLPRVIDHDNDIKSDNRIANLKDFSQRENVHKHRLGKRIYPIGVSVDKRVAHKKYLAKICKNGKQIFLGSFYTVKEAHERYTSELINT